MWQSAYRGYDVGKLSLADFCDLNADWRPGSRLSLPRPWDWGAGATYRLCVRERGTTTYRTQRPPPRVDVDVHGPPHAGPPTFPAHLGLLRVALAADGHPGRGVV
jgi:hypothetical protein